MASLMLYILLFLTFIIAAVTQSGNSNIPLESSIRPTNNPTAWFSPSGHYAFGFYPEGSSFRVGVWLLTSPENKTIIWTANRNDAPLPEDASLKLTKQGLRLVVGNTEDTISDISTEASSASMLDSGNFIISDANSEVLWQTFDTPTDTIVPGQSLSAGNQLVSSVSETNRSTGKFCIVMQNDGNLVMYPVDTWNDGADAYWASNTVEGSYAKLNLDNSGVLYLVGDNNTTFNITQPGLSKPTIVYRATLDVDGIFKLYSHDFSSSTTTIVARMPEVTNICMIKGYCGFNSYCTSTDYKKHECSCLPGFDYLDDYNGCVSSSNISGCPLDNSIMMLNKSNIVWTSDPYAELTSTLEACQDACFEDCSCEVAEYINGKCYKEKLPMRYGYVDQGVASMTFVKVSKKEAPGPEKGQEDEVSSTFTTPNLVVRITIQVT